MKKYITYFLMAAALIGGATACNEDDLTKESSFDNMTPYRTAFDEWLLDNYVTPYNIDFKYKSNTRNRIPTITWHRPNCPNQ